MAGDSQPAATSTITMPTPLNNSRTLLVNAARSFYRGHSDLIKESHGIVHAEKVYHHACNAIESLSNNAYNDKDRQSTPKTHQQRPLSPKEALEIEAAALLHDVDDEKYFPKSIQSSTNTIESESERERIDRYSALYPNALKLMKQAQIPESSHETILFMIDVVSCSKNGNSVPSRVDSSFGQQPKENTDPAAASPSTRYHLLIPRWSDRIEAVGARGVWRCYQYNQEKGRPLDLPGVTPRPRTEAELWEHVRPERFAAYMETPDGQTEDPSMLGHYYDKLLHVACPPAAIVRNEYLESKLRDSATELVEVCLRYGTTGVVDEEYLRSFRNA